MSGDLNKRAADTIRQLTVAMVEQSASGHPGGAMGGADYITVLYNEFLQFDPNDMAWPNRDRFFLDPGHMSPMLYGNHALYSFFSIEEIKAFRQWGSPTSGHPERDILRGVENTSGPLGQGHAMALGAAIAERFLVARFGAWMAHKTYAYISDGGVQEEISQGVGRLAGHLGLSNLIMFYDSNGIQLSSGTEDVTSEDTAQKYTAWGWRVISIDGNDHAAIQAALTTAQDEKARPTLIIGKTIMGKGARTASGESFEGKLSTHGMPLSAAGASFEKTLEHLGCNPAEPFTIDENIVKYYSEIKKAKAEKAREKKVLQAAWEKQNPELAKELKGYIAGEPVTIDWEAIKQKPNNATRASSGTVLAEFAVKVKNMIVSSADLANSDKTDGFLNKTTILKKGNFSGAFLQAGVAELTMAAVMNGIAAHGGIIPVCGTFFTFSDYMKPAIRLAALMQLPVKYVFTHDTFRVGEDGPTHQPIEHETQLRLLEKMANLEGKRSMLVLRPADSIETTIAWKMALEFDGPCALLLSRQNITDLPQGSAPSRYAAAMMAQKGAYIVIDTAARPDIVLIGNGSEVATLVEGAQRLITEKKLAVRVVSAISDALFREQTAEYQKSVLPDFAPTMGLTAGLPDALREIVGPLGKVIGLNRFGASAPYKVLDQKFGFTADNVVAQVSMYLDEYKAMVGAIKKLG